MSIIKKTVFIAFFCLFLPGVSVSAGNGPKIGVVDFQKVIDSSIAGKAVNSELVAFNEKWKAKIKEKGKEIEKIQKKIDEDMVINREQKEKLKREVAKKFVDFESDKKQYKEDITVLRNRKLKLLADAVLKLAKQIGEKEGYLVIMQKGGTLYYSDSADLTERMIKRYNEDYAKKK